MLLLLAVCTSCESWIDVTPTDRKSDKMLFENRDGYLEALNGIYVEMGSRDLYGRDLSVGKIDLMAQYYRASGNDQEDFGNLNYTDKENKEYFEKVWQKMYALIVNSNVIIDHCGEQNPLLPAPWFGIVKGEALALRAMLHLDLLRIFGPVPTAANANVKCIPYVTNTNQKVTPLLTSSGIQGLILKDLEAAAALLQPVDPIITEGVMNSSGVSNDLRYRQYRLNYYAVKALQARAYLWAGDKANAARCAQEVVDAKVGDTTTPVFPWAVVSEVTHGTSPDRIFSKEVIFAMYDVRRDIEVFEKIYSPGLVQNEQYTFYASNLTSGRITELYTDQNDWRYKMWARTARYGTAIEVNYFRKYDYKNPDFNDNAVASRPFRYMVPLIRMTEMHFILAECAASLAEGAAYLNNVRTHRACGALTVPDQATLNKFITAEARREFIGEGQMFFFYKRRGETSTEGNASANSGPKLMNEANYVVPLPDSEINYRTDLQ